MATSKTLAPTNVTISIPAMTDQPDASVFSNCVDKEADAINALNSHLGSCSSANGTYTTASWAAGETTCSWTATEPGIYIVWASFELADSSIANRKTYKQLQIQTNGTSLFQPRLYYDMTASTEDSFVGRTLCTPIQITQAGQYIRPYIHTSEAGIVYNINLLVMRIK